MKAVAKLAAHGSGFGAVAVILIGSGAGISQAGFATPIDSRYKLVFDDEFSGVGLRHDRWTANWLGCKTCITPPVQPSSELAAYDPANVNIALGKLNLVLNQNPITIEGRTYKYRSGMIQSNDYERFKYGYFEARIRLPVDSKTNGIANWPAFWLDGQKWPVDGEIDIAEALSGKLCYHFHSPVGSPGDCANGNYLGWHLFGVLWEPRAITYYYDGSQVGRIAGRITDSPMYIILNLGMSTIGGAILAPATMQVDYVHVYSRDPKAVEIQPDSGYGGPGDDGTSTTLSALR
jgi:beta-glucanase (GH16 family)